MNYYIALLHMKNASKNEEVLPKHIAYLDELDEQGYILGRGPFTDGSGGLVIYKAASFEEAKTFAENDPHVIEGVRSLELKEWKPILSK